MAQCRTATVDDNGGTATGKLCKVKIKSSYSGTITQELRSGMWSFNNEDNRLFKKGNYELKNEASTREGTWTWYNENGQPFVHVKFAGDQPVNLTASDSGIAVCGDDSAWVFSPDSIHFVIRFRMKSLLKSWVADQLGETYDLSGKGIKQEYKPVLGVVGVNAESPDAGGRNAEEKANIIWTDREILDEHLPEVAALLPGISTSVPAEQNLFVNPAFKPQKKQLPDGQYTLNRGMLPGWEAAAGTPDIMVENNLPVLGFRVAGSNYEAVQGRLKSGLKAGQRYCFSYQVRLKKDNNYAANWVGAWFTSRNVTFTERDFPAGKGVMVRSPQAFPAALRDSWMTIEGSFVALGGENLVYAGQFGIRDSTRFWPLDSIFNGATNGEIYYYFRDPVLIEMKAEADCICNADQCPEPAAKAEHAEPEKQTETLVLQNVQFNTARHDLLESAYPALDSLAQYLTDHEDYTMEIVGHTDNQGKPDDNLKLSEKRARAVMDYLIKQGIERHRLSYSGMGDREPIADNEEEEGRSLNRRVEFRIRKP